MYKGGVIIYKWVGVAAASKPDLPDRVGLFPKASDRIKAYKTAFNRSLVWFSYILNVLFESVLDSNPTLNSALKPA
jgi:hypothetical protein